MVLAIDSANRCDISNETHHRLLPNKSKVMLYMHKLSFGFKSGHTVWKAKCLKEYWLATIYNSFITNILQYKPWIIYTDNIKYTQHIYYPWYKPSLNLNLNTMHAMWPSVMSSFSCNFQIT